MLVAQSTPSSKRCAVSRNDTGFSRSVASQDPLGFAGGDTNLYRFCGNSPTNFTDPSGEAAVAPSGRDPLSGYPIGGAIDLSQIDWSAVGILGSYGCSGGGTPVRGSRNQLVLPPNAQYTGANTASSGVLHLPGCYARASTLPTSRTNDPSIAGMGNYYGLPRSFWNWYHRQVKRPGDPDLTKEEANEMFEEWKRRGQPDAEGHRTVDDSTDEAKEERRRLDEDLRNGVDRAALLYLLLQLFEEYGWAFAL